MSFGLLCGGCVSARPFGVGGDAFRCGCQVRVAGACEFIPAGEGSLPRPVLLLGWIL